MKTTDFDGQTIWDDPEPELATATIDPLTEKALATWPVRKPTADTAQQVVDVVCGAPALSDNVILRMADGRDGLASDGFWLHVRDLVRAERRDATARPTSAQDARTRRVLTITTSDGRRRARRSH
jgi:hypothetical protein